MTYHARFLAAVTAIALPALVDAPAPLQAQEEPLRRRGWVERAPRDMQRLDIVVQRRARLGVNVDLRAQESDSVGAMLAAVTPGGPAAKAGLSAGDIITKLDGKAVVGTRPSGADADESLPGLRLIELAAKLAPNDTVAVEFRRGNRRQTVSLVTADNLEDDVVAQGYAAPGRRFNFHLGPEGGMMHLRDLDENLVQAGPMRRFFFRSPLGKLELAPLNPELGQYFGAKEGVLVVSVPPKSALGLKGGDVVLAIDGRKPSSPGHLLRILGSYERGESFKMDVLRNRKREAVTGRIGEANEGRDEADDGPPADRG